MKYTNINLITKNLIIRKYKESDIEALHSLASIPGVGERAGWPHHTSYDQTIEKSTDMLADRGYLSIIRDQEMIGYIHLEQLPPNLKSMIADFKDPGRSAFLSYVLHPRYWNLGYTTEAVSALLDYLAGTDMDSLVSGHYVENSPSGAVLLKNGFEPLFEAEGQIWDGSTKDAIMYIRLL